MAKQNNLSLYGWLFHFNPYDGCWHAFIREELAGYFGSAEKQYPDFKSQNISTLVSIIIKCEGDPSKVEEYLKTI